MDAKEIGKRLCDLRKSFKMTKRFMAKALGISYRSVCSYEYGERIPCDETKVKIANLFGASVESIFFADGNHKT